MMPEQHADLPAHDRLISIRYFVQNMMGLKSREWFYRHKDDPGFPQRVMFGNKPMLSFNRCVAYIDQKVTGTKPPEPQPKRKRGRPRKIPLG